SEIEKMVLEVMAEEPQAVEQARKDSKAVNYLVGMVMKKTRGKADPQITMSLIKKAIGA
ncbi:MAG: Asp-tRNA(Asn)/Glu-tRNA(Gln) amidotransferase GatCAB subunit B, partial [Nitrosopumilus sp. D6]